MTDHAANGLSISMRELIGLRREAMALSLPGALRSTAPLTGNQPSIHRGRGVDFDEVRHYQPGDDIRAIDWRVTARTGVPHTKVFHEERERLVFLLVDLNPAMAFGTRTRFKSVAAAHCAAVLGWAAIHQCHRVGGLVFAAADGSEVGHRECRPLGGSRGIIPLLKAMVDLMPIVTSQTLLPPSMAANQGPRATPMAVALTRLHRLFHPGSLVFVISDFRDFDRQSQILLSEFAQRGETSAILIYDPLEANPPAATGLWITDGRGVLPMTDPAMAHCQRRLFQERMTLVKGFCRHRGITFQSIATNQPVLDPLRHGFRHLAGRFGR